MGNDIQAKVFLLSVFTLFVVFAAAVDPLISFLASLPLGGFMAQKLLEAYHFGNKD